MDELEDLQDECDRRNAELPEDSEYVWMVRCVVKTPEVEVPAVYKAWNE